MNRVAIVGAGYAGLACAVELAAAGIGTDVFEASRTLGGRARAVALESPCGPVEVDNGAHILIGAYRETLRLIQRVGAFDATALLRLPLHLEYPGEMRIAAPALPLPAPLHLAWALLTARGFSIADKFAAIRFMQAMKSKRFRLDADLPMQELLARMRQPERVCRSLWEPLCVAALNTGLERASAQVFLNVLRDSLAADRAASDLLLPRRDFSRLFPEPAAQFLAANGGRVLRGSRIETLARSSDGYRLAPHGPYNHVVLAVAPYHLPPLLAGLPELAALTQQVQNFAWETIVGAYLAYPEYVRLPFPMCGVLDGTAQWLLDRGPTHGQHGLIAAVISAHARHQELEHDELARRIHAEIASIVPSLPSPAWHRVIIEKRATFACTPGLARPTTRTALPGLWLAGDYVASDYPATIESAVRSGVAAAHSILDKPGKRPP